MASFYEACDFKFSKTFLILDGKVNTDIVGDIKADTILKHTTREGYVSIIADALRLINTPYFFWLEDDFLFNQKAPLNYMLDVMNRDVNWAGIFLSRTAPFTSAQKKKPVIDDLYIPDIGFSVSPTLCKTIHMRAAFAAMDLHEKSDHTKHLTFEPFIDSFFIQNKLKYAIMDPGEISHVEHIGLLESTDRAHHTVNSLEKQFTIINKEFVSGLGRDRIITMYNKFAMLPKLWFAIIVLSVKLFKHRVSYDFAFRIYCAYLKKFKF
ncbi:MAG: hypothetical protein V4553_12510 [Bacteroidota bacterium]